MGENSFCLGQQCYPQVPEWPGREFQDQVWEPPMSLQCSCGLQTCFLPSLRISVAFTLQCWAVVWQWQAGRLPALLSVTCHNPAPSALTLWAHCWNVPCVFCLTFLPELATSTKQPGSFHYTLWELLPRSPVLTSKLGFKRFLIISQEQSSWRPSWGIASLGLRSWGWAEGQQLCSCPHHALHDAGVDPRNLQLHPTPVPAQPNPALLLALSQT